MLIVLDTNVLLSAFLWPGKAHSLTPPILEGEIICCFSKETLEELEEVLLRPKFNSRLEESELTVKQILKVLKNNGKVFKIPQNQTNIVKADPSDDKFLLLAKKARAKYIVSGDKHLLKLEQFDGIQILSIVNFLKLFVEKLRLLT